MLVMKLLNCNIILIFSAYRKLVFIFDKVMHENHTINIYLKKPLNSTYDTIKDIALNAQAFSSLFAWNT